MKHALLSCGLVVLNVATAAAAGAQRYELPARLKPATQAAIISLADSLGQAGLPAAALYDKTAEGVLKGADDAQILAVVRALARRLREARQLLGADASDAALVAASSALYAGVPATVIRRAATARGERPSAPSLALTLTVLGALVSRDVPAEIAAASLEKLLDGGAREADLQEFQRSVEGDIAGGGAPADATTLRTQNVLRTLDARRPPGEP